MDIFVLLTNGKKETFYIEAEKLLEQGLITAQDYKIIKELTKAREGKAVAVIDKDTEQALAEKLHSIDIEKPQPQLKHIEKYTPQKLDKQIITRDKMSTSLVSLTETTKIKTNINKKSVYNIILLENIQEAITPYKNSVLQRIYSFYVNRTEQGKEAVFSLAELYEETYGTRAKHKEQLDKLADVVNFLWDFKVGIDVIAEYEARGKKYPRHELIEDMRISRLLDLELEKKTTKKGDTITIYHIVREPRFLKYARALDMYNEYPKEILAIKGAKMTEDRVAIRDAIYQAILIRKNAPYNQPLCLDNIIYDAVGDTDNIKAHFMRYYDFAVKVLEHFKAMGVINDFEIMDNYKIKLQIEYTKEHIIYEAKKLEQIEKANKIIEKHNKK